MQAPSPTPAVHLSPEAVAARAAKAGTSAENWLATRKVAVDFEAEFLSQMLSHMHQGIDTDGPFGGGHAEEMFRSMLVNEYGKLSAKAGGVGIADMVQQQMLKLQEV